jgi:hypothetical protein
LWGTWFEWLRCFVVVPTIAARTLPTVSAFIIRSGSFDLAIGQLRAYTFFYKELEGEEILSFVCLALAPQGQGLSHWIQLL